MRAAGAHLCALVVLFGLLLTACATAETTRYATWDQFFYKVQLPIPAAAPTSDVTLLVYHSYPGPLHEVRITGRSEALTIARQPAPRAKLDPTEIVSVPVRVTRAKAAQGETATLQVELQAKELATSKTVTVTVPLTAKAEQDLQQQLAIPVGSMEVRVGGFGNQVYVLYLLPSVVLLGWWAWRRRRLAQR